MLRGDRRPSGRVGEGARRGAGAAADLGSQFRLSASWRQGWTRARSAGTRLRRLASGSSVPGTMRGAS